MDVSEVKQLAPYSQPEIRAKQERLLERAIVTKCAEAVSRLGDAIRAPIISRSEIERAQLLLDEAKAAADILDPTEPGQEITGNRPFTRSTRDLNDDINRIAHAIIAGGDGFAEARAQFKRRWGI